MKKSNFNALRELLEVYQPEMQGIVTKKEKQLITKILQIEEMNPLELQNLRDFTVLYLSRDCKDIKKDRENSDKMSAIVHVIDLKKLELGGNV